MPTMKTPYPTLGEWLKNMRGEMSHHSLAKKTGIQNTTLGDIEHGIKASVNVCKKLAAYFKESQSIVLRMNGTIDDDLDVEDEPEIQGTVVAMKKMSTNLQKDVRQYALHKQKLAEGDTRDDRDNENSETKR